MNVEAIRLNRFLANAGLGSRRQCDELIQRGLVELNGTVVDQPAVRVDPARDIVTVQGRQVKLNDKLVYYLLNKLAGTITTTQDPYGRPTVLDSLPDALRIYPVGRLDFDTTGALLLTNDGELAHQLTHPSFQIPKTYLVSVKGKVPEARLKDIELGIEIENGIVAKGELVFFEYLSNSTQVRLTLREGRKREIKRIFMALGHRVMQLHRESFAFLTLEGLGPGEWRVLDPDEIKHLKELADGHSG